MCIGSPTVTSAKGTASIRDTEHIAQNDDYNIHEDHERNDIQYELQRLRL